MESRARFFLSWLDYWTETEKSNVKFLGVVYHDEQKWAKKKPFSIPIGSMYGILILHLPQKSTSHVG